VIDSKAYGQSRNAFAVIDEARRDHGLEVPAYVPLPRGEVNARHVPLPRSVVYARGYAESVAPSDSVSCIGSKRERERLRERWDRNCSGQSDRA
jgi:hypothetical protein